MPFRLSVFSAAVMAALSCLPLSVALAAVSASGDGAQSVGINSPLRLAFSQLAAMRAGQKIDITFPVVGSKTVVFEALTTGLDGTRYWHGRLDGSLGDRVYLKQAGKGVVGALRLGSRQIDFKQGADPRLLAVGDATPVTGQAYALGANSEAGVSDHHASGAHATARSARRGLGASARG